MEEFIKKAVDMATTSGGQILLAIVVSVVGLLLVKLLVKIANRYLGKTKLDPQAIKIIMIVVKIVLYVVLLIAVIEILGVPMTSVTALIASCGLAIGLAFQGALSNLAGGFLILIFRPFSIGDRIIAADTEGDVKELNMFYTVVLTPDNQTVTIPNGNLMAGNITNATKESLRRVDLTFNVSGSDLAGARNVMLEQMKANDKVLSEPAPIAEPLEGVPGGMSFTARAWAKTEDYWDVYFGLMEAIPTALGEAGVGGPLPAYHVIKEDK